MSKQLRTLSPLALVLAIVALFLGVQPAEAQRGALEGTLVDTDGNPVAKHTLIFTPLAGGGATKLKTKASGKFAHGFMAAGQYTITSAEAGAYLSHFDVVVTRQPGGSEVTRWASDADPDVGLPPFTINSAHKTTLSVVLSDEAHRRRVRQAIASAAVAGPLQAAMDRYDAGDMEGTLREAQRVLAEQPELAYGHFIRGVALTALGRTDEAVQALRTAVELDAELPDASGALGTVLLQQATKLQPTDAEKAQALFTESAGLLETQAGLSDPPDAAVLTNLAMALDKSDQDARAMEVLQRLIEVDPNSQAAYYHLADLHRQAGDEETALAVLETIPSGSEEDGSSADVIYNMAVQAFNAGEYDKALEVLDRALGVDPDFVLAHHLRGRVYLAQEDYEGARRELSRFVELAPDHASAEEDRMILDSLASMGDG